MALKAIYASFLRAEGDVDRPERPADLLESMAFWPERPKLGWYHPEGGPIGPDALSFPTFPQKVGKDPERSQRPRRPPEPDSPWPVRPWTIRGTYGVPVLRSQGDRMSPWPQN